MDEQQRSLIDRMTERLSARPAAAPRERVPPAIAWRFAAVVAGTIALGPLLTLTGAQWLAGDARADAERIAAAVAPQVAAAAHARQARALLAGAVGEAPVALWLDRAAVALPADARVSRMARAADGTIEIDITSPDPDQVRAAMRRDPAFSGFRERGQRRAGALILVTYRRVA